MAKWAIYHSPRSLGDRRPWKLYCPHTMPDWAWYEQGTWCYCRRFKTGRAAISFFNRRVVGGRIVRVKNEH